MSGERDAHALEKFILLARRGRFVFVACRPYASSRFSVIFVSFLLLRSPFVLPEPTTAVLVFSIMT